VRLFGCEGEIARAIAQQYVGKNTRCAERVDDGHGNRRGVGFAGHQQHQKPIGRRAHSPQAQPTGISGDERPRAAFQQGSAAPNPRSVTKQRVASRGWTLDAVKDRKTPISMQRV